jgi:hypothetical protein
MFFLFLQEKKHIWGLLKNPAGLTCAGKTCVLLRFVENIVILIVKTLIINTLLTLRCRHALNNLYSLLQHSNLIILILELDIS